VSGRWRCELSGDVVGGGEWHERQAGLADLPHYTRIDDQQTQQQQPAAAAAADTQLDAATDCLDEIDIS